MATILVTGANRGLGLEFVRQYAADGNRVHACCRDPKKADALAAVAAAHKGAVILHALDVTDEGGVAALAHALSGETIDVLINNAGVGGDAGRGTSAADNDAWMRVLAANTIAPYRMALAFHAALARAKPGKLITISSMMGSSAHHDGHAFVYRASKAAVNNVMLGLAQAWRRDGIVVVPLSPGWVRTDMGGPNAPLAPEQSVSAMRDVIRGLTLADTGRYLEYSGKDIPL